MEPSRGVSEQRKFGKYTLVAKLAQGGMAEIFLARLGGAAGFEKLVCIKRILPELVRDPQFVSMFLDEARIAARISHHNVCQVFELGELEGQYYIAMEYLEGVPLQCFRKRELYAMPPDPRLVTGIAVQACEGLQFAHQLKASDGGALEVVHRDVSPQNLFVTTSGVVKVLDFGIAKVQDASTKTTTGSVKGTYSYMAPEQLKGERVDRRADVFALGAVVWETLARKHLFRRESDFLTFQAITTDTIPDVCMFRPDVPPELGAVIARALMRDREARFPTIRAFGEALARAALPLGGVMSANEISDEVVRAFQKTVDEQHALVEAARAGGEFDLVDASGSGLYGIDAQATPTSHLKRRSDLMRVEPGPPSAAISVAIPGPPTAAITIPTAPARSRAWLLIVLVLLAAAGGAGAVYYFLVYKAAVAPPQTVAIATPPAIARDAAIPDARVVIVDAAEPDAPAIPADASEPVDAAVERHLPTPVKPLHPPPPPPPTGPPGSITIDSSPGYAIIFIDGKRYGETPLANIKLSPGRHAVRAVSPSGASQNLSITIESGKKAPGRRIEW